ncbi:hypothetical protein PAT3040_03985 [Paenibacillus agaridevorans]|uniref:DUF2500 domain-containing protein n=1 Tax=Paenibacillus agaridevorans TaxID=171404 RepID=A0A2R5F0Y2_9BACL|nr:DUF2500 family protein [Paenibacillus agaridevorans]GBG09341.1 hypothetical protein PAT3040_03985 [Paenibacillus agaridevorans]
MSAQRNKVHSGQIVLYNYRNRIEHLIKLNSERGALIIDVIVMSFLVVLILFFVYWYALKRIPTKSLNVVITKKNIREFAMRNGKYKSLIIVVLTESGEVLEFQSLSIKKYNQINEGDKGIVFFKGEFLVDFTKE